MAAFEVRAPGVVKLFGEHAVVYGRLSVAAAIDMYATVSVRERRGTDLRIILQDFSEFSVALDRRRLGLLYRRYRGRESMQDFVGLNNDIDPKVLPYATIASRLANEFGVEVVGKEVRISSEIPTQRGSASSAACATAFTVAMLRSAGEALEDSIVIDIARDGERVVHLSDGAGRIDVAASYYGGYASTSDGGKREKIRTRLNMVLIDTGPKKSTAETVGSVRILYDKEKEKTEKLLDAIEDCSVKGLKALSKGDLKMVGEYMYKDQELLRELGVSSKGLDRAVELARENGAYGAKLSGGGGGGIAIAICKNPERLMRVMGENGFDAYPTSVTLNGAEKYLR